MTHLHFQDHKHPIPENIQALKVGDIALTSYPNNHLDKYAVIIKEVNPNAVSETGRTFRVECFGEEKWLDALWFSAKEPKEEEDQWLQDDFYFDKATERYERNRAIQSKLDRLPDWKQSLIQWVLSLDETPTDSPSELLYRLELSLTGEQWHEAIVALATTEAVAKEAIESLEF